MQKFINIDPVEPGMVPENISLLDYDNTVLAEKDLEDTMDDSSNKGLPVATGGLQSLDEITSQAYRPPRDSKALKEPKSIRK